jgi:hypothetical protein
MGFIKHALIGIVLYEAVRYIMHQENLSFARVAEGTRSGSARHQFRAEDVDIIGGARQTDQLDRLKEKTKIT